MADPPDAAGSGGAGPFREAPDKPLNPVERPAAGCLPQLLFVLAVIAASSLVVWLLFSRLAHMGGDPRSLVRDLREPNEASWRKAFALSQMLRHPESDDLRANEDVALELASVLQESLDAGQMDRNHIKLRVFLCRALGEFRSPTVLPVLTLAVSLQRSEAEIDVRRAALEGIAVFAEGYGPAQLRGNLALMDTIQSASRERAEGSDEGNRRAELRSAAAFALGVIGGADAMGRLEQMLADPHANVRYNAATGLSRHGDVRALPGLIEMLEPSNDQAVEYEVRQADKDRKRIEVIANGTRACVRLLERNPCADYRELEPALRKLTDSDLQRIPPEARRGIRLEAEEALHVLRSRDGTMVER